MSDSWRVRIQPFVLSALAARAAQLGRSVPHPHTRIFDEGLLDSVRYVELVDQLEGALGIEIDGLEIDPEALHTVGDLVEQLTGAVMDDESSAP